MLAVFPVCHKDYQQAVQLLTWCRELPSYKHHAALIVASAELAPDQIDGLVALASRCGFSAVSGIAQREIDDRGWPESCNSMFRVAADYVEKIARVPFFWCEPDCIPVRPGWLDALEAEYRRLRRPFMGFIWDQPWRHLSGCAVYPPNIRRYNPYMLNGSKLPFDTIRSDLTLRGVAHTPLIQHEWGDVATNTPWTFPTRASLRRIKREAVLFHRCKDGSLILRLFEQKNDGTADPSMVEDLDWLTQAAYWLGNHSRLLLRGCSSYYHSGNLGDIIYALSAIKLHGGGDLLIGPVQMGTSPCSMPVNREQYDLLRPLLAEQPYLRKSEFRDKYPKGEVLNDLNRFRDSWNDWKLRNREGIHTLAKMHAYALGVTHMFNDTEPWLTVPRPIKTDRIIVHRSQRYNSTDFPWRSLVHDYKSRLLFVGHEDEYRIFTKQFGAVSYWRIQNFLELAQLIAGGVAFVGNQSFPCSIALGCGQRVFQETWAQSPDCVLQRENFLNQHDGIAKFDEWFPEETHEPKNSQALEGICC